MTKAQSFFGGTNPKQTGEPGRRVGHSSAGTHNTSQQLRDEGAGPYSLKPPITRYSSGGKGNNHQMHRDPNFKTAPLGHPQPKGKSRGKVGQ